MQPVDNVCNSLFISVIYVLKNRLCSFAFSLTMTLLFDITITLLCSYMFVHYGFGYTILNGVKIKWGEDLNLESYTLGTQMKITHLEQCLLLWHMVLSVGDYLHKDLLLQ